MTDRTTAVAGTATTGATTSPVVEIAHASFGYGDRAVVLDTSLTVHAGERVALLGPNGCGKSTLVKGLLGLCNHLGGDVRLFGTPLASFSERHRLGYVPQRNVLATAGAATVEEIVGTGRLARQGLFARQSRADKDAVADAVEVVGLADRRRTPVATLSGGQQRRTLIARALAAGPEVLVMDEPTAGVDTANQSALVDVLARLADRGTTLLVVLHETELFRPVLRRAVAMQDGRVRYDGPLASLPHDPLTGLGTDHCHV